MQGRGLLLLVVSFGGLLAWTHSAAQAVKAEARGVSSPPSNDPGSTAPVLHSSARNVVLDIVVTDDSGHPVHNLAESDFIVEEDKTPQRIHLVGGPMDAIAPQQAQSIATVHGSPASNGGNRQRTRNIILLDEMNVRFLDLALERQRLAIFLRSEAARGQTFAVMAMTTTRILLVHDFTQDGSALATAVDHLPAVLPATGSNDYVDQERELEDLRTSIGVVETIAHAMSGSPEHTNLFWITSGFPTLSYISTSGETQFTFDEVMRHASNLYLNARMTLYTIDPHGVQTESTLPDHSQPGSGGGSGSNGFLRGSFGGGDDGAQFLAETDHMTSNRAVANSLLGHMDARTGGRAYGNQNYIDLLLAKALEDGSSVYTVAYSPLNKNFHGEFRQLHVRLNRPGLHARTREGYYALAEGGPPTPAEQRAQLQVALDSPLRYEGLQVQGEIANSDKGSMLRVKVAAPEVEWRYDDTGAHVAQTVAVAAYSSRNTPIESQQWHVTVARSDLDAKREILYSLPLKLPANTARLRVAVVDKDGTRIGTNDVSIELPHK